MGQGRGGRSAFLGHRGRPRRIPPPDRLAVPSQRLAGWLGHVVVQGPPAIAENAPEGLQYVTCEGEGVLLLSKHGDHR
jgi:hypothetical protein